MTRIRHIWDGFLSLIAALLAAAVTLTPAWAAHLAIGAGLVPAWVYAALAGLVAVGAIMVLAFLRKMRAGVSPLRERPRR